MSAQREHCDVLVVGGGPAGAAAALTLRRQGLQVVLIEASDYERFRAGETLLPRVREPLSALALPGVLAELGSLPSYGNRSAWGASEVVSHSFFGSVGSHGYHVDRRRFDAALAERCADAGVGVRRSTRSRTVRELQGGSFEMVDAFGGCMLASAIIDASGKSASVATQLGGRRERLDKLIAIVGQFEQAPPHCYTLVEASSDGWWYSAPVPEGRLIVANLTDPDLHTRLKNGFMQRLQATVHTRERIETPTPLSVRCFSAGSQRLQLPSGPRRWLAVGDAALCADPLSGTGVQRALESGVAGANALIQRLGGNLHALEQLDATQDLQYARYLRQRHSFYGAETRFVDHAFWQRRALSLQRC